MIKIEKKNALDKTTKTVKFSLGMTPLFFIFLVLKLTHVIDWSWWWVTSPLWLPTAALLGVVGIFLLIMLFVGIFVLIFDR